jgi:DNA-binding MurR/RpiR family transcriptional regulator
MRSYEDRIRESRPNLSPSFSLLADYLLDSYTQSAFLTATELAHKLDIDPATVVRFSQHLGYRGYPELQREIRQKVKGELFFDRMPEANTVSKAAEAALAEVTSNLEVLRRSFPFQAAEQLINMLDEVERVLIMSEGLAKPPAHSLAAWLEAAGHTVFVSGGGPSELARSIAGIRKGDLVLTVCIAEETHFIANALAEAQKAGAHTAAIVAAPSSEVTLYADLIIATRANQEHCIGQIIIETMIYMLVRMLRLARPGRYEKAAERISTLTHRLASGKPA